MRLKKGFIYVRDKGRCRYCRRPLTVGEATVDHVVPKSKMGGSKATNLVLSCRGCNQAKGSLSVEQFRAKKKRLLTK